jgi:hypothetical protein
VFWCTRSARRPARKIPNRVRRSIYFHAVYESFPRVNFVALRVLYNVIRGI